MCQLEVAEVLDAFAAAVAARVPGARVLLYGSRARGDYLPDSDIDVLVVLPTGREAEHQQVWEALGETNDAAPLALELLSVRGTVVDLLGDAAGANALADGVEWGPGATLPPPEPHDRDAPPPWRRLPGPEWHLKRAAAGIERGLRTLDECRDHTDVDAGLLLGLDDAPARISHDLLRALLLAAHVAPPRTARGRSREVLRRVQLPATAGLTVAEAVASVERAAVLAEQDRAPVADVRACLEALCATAHAVIAYTMAQGWGRDVAGQIAEQLTAAEEESCGSREPRTCTWSTTRRSCGPARARFGR